METMEQVGEFSLCLLMAARSKSVELLRETLQGIGNTLTEKEGVKAYKLIQLDLDPKDRDWLKGQMLKLYDNASRCTQRNVPYTAYLWTRLEKDALESVVSFRLPADESALLDQLAEAEGLKRGEFARKLFRERLSQTD